MHKKNRTNTRPLSILRWATLLGTSFACNDPLVLLGSNIVQTTDLEDPASTDSDSDPTNADTALFGTESDSAFVDDVPYDTDRDWEWSEWSQQCRSCAVDYCACIADENVFLNDDTDNTAPFNDTNNEKTKDDCGAIYDRCALLNCVDNGPPNVGYPELVYVDCNHEFLKMMDVESAPGAPRPSLQ